MRTKYFRHWTCDNCDKKAESEFLPNFWEEYEFKRITDTLEIHLCDECSCKKKQSLIKWLFSYFGR